MWIMLFRKIAAAEKPDDLVVHEFRERLAHLPTRLPGTIFMILQSEMFMALFSPGQIWEYSLWIIR